MDFDNNYYYPRYNLCAGRGCRKKGTNRLRIQFLKKIGFFCDACTNELLALDIATKDEKI